MTETSFDSYTTFAGHRLIASGSLQVNALASWKAREDNPTGQVLIFDDATGRAVDVDIRGTDKDIAARFANEAPVEKVPDDEAKTPESLISRGRGRPRLGVTSREVTLLPRHWDWLATQPGGASIVLRKLVEEARRAGASEDKRRMAHERAYHFMQAIGGDLPGFEEAIRALFANDALRVSEILASWPQDVREHAIRLAFGS
ncbi:DUF2239 family protein [Erwiniaceae bacterium BAC15a-03b]|uniref:DUF2239 family protein n=1 Tax=Winslowiella arboricola TaxID=2978220 RepID=A0A9J6PUJ4_9GAMM|nr:DUF2239 family protein [Winslowiella arboricola]MCU5775269.1 DUF2239 family protein [Winslowiella arboricola]MCU5780334.1 DUF2239 family protein [Winslowiella arboricola]